MTYSEHELEFTFAKNYWTGLYENFTTDASVVKEELIKFWKSSASGSGNFLKILQHCERVHSFHNLARISVECSNFHENFITYVSLDKEIHVKFWRYPESGSEPDFPWRRYAVSDCCWHVTEKDSSIFHTKQFHYASMWLIPSSLPSSSSRHNEI